MSITTTPLYALPAPDANEPWARGNERITALADAIDPKLTPHTWGVAADRPVSSPGSPSNKPGRTYRSTDIALPDGLLEMDTGSGWIIVNGGLVDGGALSLADRVVTPTKLALLSFNDQTGTSYTVAASDESKLLTCTNAAPFTLNIALNATVAIPVGFQTNVVQGGAGQVTVNAVGGVTLKSYQSKIKIAGPEAGVTLIKIATNTWRLIGNLG